MASTLCLCQQTIPSECGMLRLASHWVSHSQGTVTLFSLLQSRQMDSALFLVQRMVPFGCGMRRLARKWVPHSEGTLPPCTLSQSRLMESTLCQVHVTALSVCGTYCQ